LGCCYGEYRGRRIKLTEQSPERPPVIRLVGRVGSFSALSTKPHLSISPARSLRLTDKALIHRHWISFSCAFHLRFFLQRSPEFDHRQGISRAVLQQGLFNRRPLDPIRFDKDHSIILTGSMPSLLDRQIVIGEGTAGTTPVWKASSGHSRVSSCIIGNTGHGTRRHRTS
jgi:hypothetical protein